MLDHVWTAGEWVMLELISLGANPTVVSQILINLCQPDLITSQWVQWRMIGSMMIYLCGIHGYIPMDQ